MRSLVTAGLPKAAWTHEAHVAIGACYVLRYGESAVNELRRGIKRHNAAVGTVDTPTSGYHETLTCFWAGVVSRLVRGASDPWLAARQADGTLGMAPVSGACTIDMAFGTQIGAFGWLCTGQPGLGQPYSTVLSPNGRIAYVAGYQPGAVTALRVADTDGALVAVGPCLPAGQDATPQGVARPDGGRPVHPQPHPRLPDRGCAGGRAGRPDG